MAYFASVPELSSVFFRLDVDESHSPNQFSSLYSTFTTESDTGAPCNLNLGNQVPPPHGQFAGYTPDLLHTIDIHTPSCSVERACSEYHRCLIPESRGGSPEDGSDHRLWMSSKTPYHPYIRELKNPRRKRMPAVKYESDPSKLQQRCSRDGGDSDAIESISKVFSKGVTLSALTRQKTAEEVVSQAFGQGPGQVYLGFLETIQTGKCRDEKVEFRYRCRLCPGYAEAASWKHERDVLRHLRKHHFGLANECEKCGKRGYTTSEMRNHRCVLTKRSFY